MWAQEKICNLGGVDGSLIHHVALLVPLSGSIDLSWFYRVGKRLPVKADLAIYSTVSDVSVWC